MEIVIIRKFKKETYTIGQVLVDGKYFCNSLEQVDRGLDCRMTLSQLKKMKVYGRTAIPTGTYNVRSYFWAKHRKSYPLLLNVPAFEGVLLHGGNKVSDSMGCPLLGENKVKGGLVNCEKYVRKITQMVIDAEKRGEKVTITIK